MDINPLIEPSVNIIIDECYYSKVALVSLVECSSPSLKVVSFSNVDEFTEWNERNDSEINMVLIHIHDRMNEQLVRFLVEDIKRFKINNHKIIIMSDAISKLKVIFTNKLNIIHFLDDQSDIAQLKTHLKFHIGHCVAKLCVSSLKGNKEITRRHSKRDLSPAERSAVTHVYTGKGIKERKSSYCGHYKTLYNQRLSAIRKLGLSNVQDLIKYRHLISAVYLIENNAYHCQALDVFC